MPLRIEESTEKRYAPTVSVYLDDVEEDDRDEIAGMLRGLMCAIQGHGRNSGLTNEYFASNSPVILRFASADHAARFKACVDYYFSDGILDGLKVKRRIFR